MHEVVLVFSIDIVEACTVCHSCLLAYMYLKIFHLTKMEGLPELTSFCMNDFPLPTDVWCVMLTALQVTNLRPPLSHTQHGEPFTDPEFPPTDKSLYIDPKKPVSKWQVGKWERPRQLRGPFGSGPFGSGTTKWTVVREPRPDNVAQGELGNCWYVCVLLHECVSVHLLPILLTHVGVKGSTDGLKCVYRIR